MSTCIYIYICSHIYHLYLETHGRKCVYIYIYIYACIYSYSSIYVRACMYVCLCEYRGMYVSNLI